MLSLASNTSCLWSIYVKFLCVEFCSTLDRYSANFHMHQKHIREETAGNLALGPINNYDLLAVSYLLLTQCI